METTQNAAASPPSVGARPSSGLRVAGLAAVLALAALLRLAGLDQNGFDNEYYAAAVRSMTASGHAFLYNSFDPAGFVSVDKPPLALWVQVAAAKVLGFRWLAVLLPQVLEGMAAVLLVYHLVRRSAGAGAGLLAALFQAVMPVSVAVDRSGNTDSCLVLVLLLAAWALIRAAESGRRGPLLLAMALVGLGFNVKMLAAYVGLPTFALVYALGAGPPWRRRLADLVIGGAVLAAVSLPWLLVYDLTPPANRPFVGSSRHNSMVELAVGHNGVGRFVRLWTPAAPRTGDGAAPAARPDRAAPAGAPGTWPWRLFVREPAGPLRLTDGQLAAQSLWLAPLAIVGLLAGAARGRWRPPLGPAPRAALLWVGWALTYGIVYSYAGGIFHFYYLATMAPPIAALAGIGAVRLWTLHRGGGWRAGLLPLGLLLTAAWQVHVESSALGRGGASALDRLAGLLATGGGPVEWPRWLHAAMIGGALAAAVALAALSAIPRTRRVGAASAGALAVGLAALLAVPTAWALSSVLIKGVAVVPSADLARLTLGGQAAPWQSASRRAASAERLVSFLEANRQGERYLLATSGTRIAAPVIIDTGQPAMAIGGFHGLDPILTPEALARLVASRQVRFVMLGDLSVVSRRMGGEEAMRPIAEWVRANGRPVDPSLWRAGAAEPAEPSGRRASAAGRPELCDLRPEAALHEPVTGDSSGRRPDR